MPLSPLGVVVVTFNSEPVILDCLESLLTSRGVPLRIAVVDNDSPDRTVTALRDWASGKTPYQKPDDIPFDWQACTKPIGLDGSASEHCPHQVTLIETGINGGFAAGVNAGLAYLANDPEIDRFWILNPDGVAFPQAPAAFASLPAPEGGFSLIGGRVLYLDGTDRIQIDGGTIKTHLGVTGNVNQGRLHAETPPPTVEQMDFITGASMVVSRQFYEQAGPMTEDYFLYYEEVDWALQRGALPMLYCPDGVVYHRAGTAIGSPTLSRPATPFSLYFKHRCRMRFVRRHFPSALPTAFLYSVAKSAQLLLKGYPIEAWTIMQASLGLPPSKAVRNKLTPAAQKRAFGK